MGEGAEAQAWRYTAGGMVGGGCHRKGSERAGGKGCHLHAEPWRGQDPCRQQPGGPNLYSLAHHAAER